MRFIKEFKKESNIDYHRIDVGRFGFSRRMLVDSFDSFKKFMEDFECSLNELLEILYELHIYDKSLFDYSIIGDDKFLISENDVYTTRYDDKAQKVVKVYHKVFISESEFVSLALNKVAKELVKRNMPFLFNPPFLKCVRRFDDSISKMPDSRYAKLGDIDSMIVFNNNLTIDDVIKIYTIDGYKDSMMYIPTFSVYADGKLYISLDDDMETHSINTTYKQLKNKDWGAIKSNKVYSIRKYDEMGNPIAGDWFAGNQVDAPYFGKGERFKIIEKYCLDK